MFRNILYTPPAATGGQLPIHERRYARLTIARQELPGCVPPKTPVPPGRLRSFPYAIYCAPQGVHGRNRPNKSALGASENSPAGTAGLRTLKNTVPLGTAELNPHP